MGLGREWEWEKAYGRAVIGEEEMNVLGVVGLWEHLLGYVAEVGRSLWVLETRWWEFGHEKGRCLCCCWVILIYFALVFAIFR